MKRLYLHTISVACTTIFLAACNNATPPHNHHEGEHEHDHEHIEVEHDHDEAEHNHAEAEHEQHDPTLIHFHEEQAERFGVQIDTIKPSSFASVLDAWGVVTSASGDVATVVATCDGIATLPSSLQIGHELRQGQAVASINTQHIAGGDANAAAAVDLEAARIELERLTSLLDKGMATRKEVAEAQAAYDRAKTSYSPSAASKRAVAPISGTLTNIYIVSGEYVTAGQPIARVARNSRLVIKIDVPYRYIDIVPSITSANFLPEGQSKWISLSEVDGKRINQTISQDDATKGYLPIYFSVLNNGLLTPGMSVEAKLLGSVNHDAIAVPISALVEQQGQWFVFEAINHEHFRKVKVDLGSSNGYEVVITSPDLKGIPVVTKGATMIRLAQSETAVPEGHSHNH